MEYKDTHFSKLKITIRNNEVHEGQFTAYRVDRSTVPDGLHVYNIRHSDDDGMEPASISGSVWVNHYGTLILKEKLNLKREEEILDYEFLND